ncbi:putative RPM1-interacting protein 4/NOI4 [Helianthus annuus]|uniref:Putative RIN4, pathogenic type III effector avirulence factor Avr cleavage site n=1 Tax=Helianthus annuus TaxID=4232 RepID=A0A251UAP9_HELAN|nr:RPM1-interacting protein 4 [Helianthus annuus]KAF5798106.1 putative RPM1-interacting protein 4/NOI4 [Helianthus annuus]KAJ0549749.1 putative RPM1-interacting protein 4/NOI4 [Helianthus annuus]KAJ0556255.1 putative RPM1-interacting protein 4/NOI4 [Helianthus annuus]KAJ0562703.1 putative RPM1-interacting protein 4/NOI4 [Helianthus annuus]KAJ0728080.1 putative RPM1-interacting protein 4/NOI4 [Helianthus annuus]
MAKRPTVPKFGNWENEGNTPYTTYFNEARKGKAAGGKMINPNDPEDNPEMFAAKTEPPPLPHDHRVSREEERPAPNDNPNKRNSGGPANQRGGGQGTGTGRPVRHSVGSDQSFDRSPLHPHYQAKVTGKGGASPAREGKNSYDSSHGTPGRSRMKPARGDDSPDNGAAVPRFGDWDENNPSSGENYTHIFNKVREERVTGSPMVSGSDARPNYNIPRNQKPEKQCCCFPWSK